MGKNFAGGMPTHLSLRGRFRCPVQRVLESLTWGKMSWQAVTWVLEQSESTLGARLVLLAIASHANREGKNSWPSTDTIALETRLSIRDVYYCLKMLRDSGELAIRSGKTKGVANRYALPLVEKWVDSIGTRSAKIAEGGMQNPAKGSAMVADEPFLNRNLEPSKGKAAEETVSIHLKEPSQDTETEMNRIAVRRTIHRAAKENPIPRKMSPSETEQRRQLLLRQGEEIKKKYAVQ